MTNTGNTDLQLFLDPRLVQRQLYSLTPITQATGVALPVSLDAPPEFLVPTQTNLLLASAQGSAPLTVDWGFGDPDLLMASHGDDATGAFAQSEVTNGIWSITPALTGPIAPDGETGTVDTGLVGRTRVFDTSVSSPPGDPLLQYVDPTADAGTPIDLAGRSVDQDPGHVHRRPAVAARSSPATCSSTTTSSTPAQTNELGDIPYRYRVGR